MTIYIDYGKAKPFLIDRNNYIEKYTTRKYNQFGDIVQTVYNAPNCLICIDGSYIEANDLLQVVPNYSKKVVNKFLMELRNPNNNYQTQMEFKWKKY